jgi:hypothetical protein
MISLLFEPWREVFLRLSRSVALLATLLVCWPIDATHASENLALGKAYSFSRSPLYDLTRDDGDATQLTDGKVARDTIWTSKDSVGWHADAFPISIGVDLERRASIGTICIRTARRSAAGVEFPKRIDFFLSDDGTNFSWAGLVRAHEELGSGDYLVRDVCLRGINRDSRYVRVQVATKGGYFFSDEITVLASGRSAATALMRRMPTQDLHRFAVEHEAVGLTLDALRRRFNLDARTKSMLQKLDVLKTKLHGSNLDLTDLFLVDAEIRNLIRDGMIAVGETRIATRVDPWGSAGFFGSATLVSSDEAVDMPANGHAVVAFDLRHDRATPTTIRVSARVSGVVEATTLSVSSFRAVVVTRADGVRIADPLVPLQNESIVVGPGETVQVWFDIDGGKAISASRGDVEFAFAVTSEGPGSKQSVRVPLRLRKTHPGASTPATVIWGYLADQLVRDKPVAAVADMFAHHIDTAVLPASDIPWPAQPIETLAGARSQLGNYQRFDRTMAHMAGHRRYLFFLAMPDSRTSPKFRSNFQPFTPEWNELFKAWIREWTADLLSKGLRHDDFAFYPVDEPHAGNESDALMAIATLIKAVDSNLKIYTTLHVPNVLNDSLLKVVDIFQLNGAALSAPVVSRLTAAGKEVWSYGTAGGKAASPQYYRMQAWEAASLGLNGFGFWSYSDANSKGTAWDDLDGLRPDFAVIYDDPTRIISSKRWEAWREGWQDFMLLTGARKVVTTDAERTMVEAAISDGLASIDDLKRFADVRRKLFDFVDGKREHGKGGLH